MGRKSKWGSREKGSGTWESFSFLAFWGGFFFFGSEGFFDQDQEEAMPFHKRTNGTNECFRRGGFSPGR